MPKLSLQLYEHLTDQCVDKLCAGSLYLAIISGEINDPRLNSRLLFKENFELICPKNHPLAKQKSVRSCSIPHDELLLLQEGHCLRSQALNFCNLIKATPNVDYTATSFATLIAMVSFGEGITLVPALSVSSINKGALAVRPLKTPCPTRTIYLYWRRSFKRDYLIEKLSDTICQAVSDVAGIT